MSQTQRLESVFIQHKYLTPSQRSIIAVELKLTERQVKTWFQNRRAKWRRIQQVFLIKESLASEFSFVFHTKNFLLHKALFKRLR